MSAAPVADLVARMVVGRAFSMATGALVDHAALLDEHALRVLIRAVCASYDECQFNTYDEVGYGRRAFVECLAGVVDASPARASFVDASTAMAFAFHPTTRRVFIGLAASGAVSADRLDALFADRPYREIGSGGERIGMLVLRDVYWGRDADEHVARFLSAGRAPYAATWHAAEHMTLRCPSLVIGAPARPMLATLATAARRGLLRRANVSMCGKFLDADPASGECASVRDGVAVARVLGVDALGTRFCPHLGLAGARAGPTGLVERLVAYEQLICTLEPLGLPDHVVYLIADWLAPVGKRRHNFMTNVDRVTKRARALREKHIDKR